MGEQRVWIVTPHHSADFDDWIGPAETEQDHRAALRYAKERLEEAWDELVGDDEATVTMRLDFVDEDELPEDFGNIATAQPAPTVTIARDRFEKILHSAIDFYWLAGRSCAGDSVTVYDLKIPPDKYIAAQLAEIDGGGA